jgi:HSP20 family protein
MSGVKKILILIIAVLSLSAPVSAQNTGDDYAPARAPDAEQQSEEATMRDFQALRRKMGVVRRELDLLMRDMASTVSGAVAGQPAAGVYGSDVYVDVMQTEKNVVVKADLPGMDKDKISITLDNNRFLKISGSREVMKSEKAPGVVRRERFSGSFMKIVELPCEVTPAGINATYKDGVLEVVIPKKAKAKEETVKIAVK